ncbi:unnamed protein product [Echinostoma caproni]|uniref:Uncharacterized protein n=1 Tax=Echinostoma caproni TaxID=27848 RepID=A0A183BA58_9TREM|nr:unnamed protein product [Echinostoma caproni]
MVEITDLRDATVHRRQIDQIHFNENPTPIEDPADEAQENPSRNTPSTTTEDHTQQLSTPGMSTDECTFSRSLYVSKKLISFIMPSA